jgi:hypothetical protein
MRRSSGARFISPYRDNHFQDVGRKSPAHGKRLAAPQSHCRVALAIPFESLDVHDRDERLQRLLDEFLAAGVPERRVFLLGDKAGDVLDRDESQLVARAHGDPRARAPVSGRG